MQTNSSVWRDCGITGKPTNKSRQLLWLKESEWTPQHPPPSWVPGVCDDSACPVPALLPTESFLPQPFPVVLPWVLNKPQQGLEGQYQSLPITAQVTPHLPHEGFPAGRKKTRFYQYIQETWRRNSKGHRDKEMDWYSQTFVVLLLYPTPMRDSLCFFPAVSI